MVNVLAPARSASALYSRPWMGQTGTYPGAAQGNALMGMAQPAAPQTPMAPQMPSAPVYAGSQAITGMGQGDGADVGGQPSVESPNQSALGVLGALGTAASFGLSPMGALAGMLAGIGFDDNRGQQIGTTQGFVDMALQTAGMPTVGQLISSAYGSVFGGGHDFGFGIDQGNANVTGTPAGVVSTDAFSDPLNSMDFGLGVPGLGGFGGEMGGFGGGPGGAPSGPGDFGGMDGTAENF